jgi:hypothetical protein
MAKLSVFSWIGNAAAVLFGKHGDVTTQAHQAGCSRQTAYDHAHKVQQAVASAQQPGPDRDQLLGQVQDLRRQVQDLQRQLRDERRRRDDRVELGRVQQRRVAVPLHAMGLSLNQIEDTFALLLPKGRAPDRSTIGHWVRAAQHQAGNALATLDNACRPRAETLALDEIFFRHQPCLVGVEPASMALLLCQRTAERTAATWKEALLPFTGLNYVCADAGTGLQKALAEIDADRRRAQQPPLERGLDHFHTAREAQRVLGRLWKGVEARWDEAEETDRKCVAAQRKGRDGRGPAARARVAWERVARAMEWYDGRAAAWQRARQALTLLGSDGRLNDPTQAERDITAACAGLPGRPWKKVRTFLKDRRTLTFLERAQRQLAVAEPRPELREALMRLWGLERAAAACRPSQRCGGGASLAAVVVQRVICARLAEDWAESYGRVRGVLAGVVRASSAVECMNSVLRMQQGRQRRMSQGMLDLKRLYWNCRRFRSGRRKDRCPYQLLGLQLPTYDFWELLHADTPQPAEEPSTTEVAA